MRITLNGTFGSLGALRHSNVDEYGYNFAGDAGRDGTVHYVAWYRPNTGDAWNEGYQNTLTDMKAVLTISVTKKSGIYDDGLLLRYYKNAPLDGVNNTEEDLYRSLAEYNIYGAEFIGATETVNTGITSNNRETTITVTVTDPAKLQYLLANGIGFDSAYGNLYRVSGVTLALSGESTEDAPVVTVDTGYLIGTMSEGVYYHPAGDQDFYAGITYSQNLGTAMQVMRYTVKDAAGAVVLAGETAAKSFLVPRSLWASFPASGSIEMTAVSAHGIPSEAAVLSWVVSHYDVRVSTPVSGSIIQTGEDVVLSWNLVLPEGMPSAPMPSRYTIWPAWDDSEEFQVAFAVTDRTYTIPADSLAGHTKLKLLILDEYGSAVRAMSAGALVQLYLQPSASVNGITVGTEHADGKYTPLLTVMWESEGQTAFRITADDFDTGPVWGSAQQYTIPKIFDDGVHVIRLRIQDANGTWGAWSEPVYADVQNPGTGGAVALTASAVASGVRLSIQGSGDALHYADVLIYRNGKLAAQLPGTATMVYEYIDTEACGVCTYTVRLAIDHGVYAQSETVTVDAAPETDGILLPDGKWLALRYTQSAPRAYRSTQNEDTYSQHFAGREYPVSMRSGRRTKVLSMEYIDRDGTICDVLEANTGAVVLYKTTLGFGIRGELNNVTAGRGKAWNTVSFRLSQCAEPAELQYVQGVNAVGI